MCSQQIYQLQRYEKILIGELTKHIFIESIIYKNRTLITISDYKSPIVLFKMFFSLAFKTYQMQKGYESQTVNLISVLELCRLEIFA